MFAALGYNSMPSVTPPPTFELFKEDPQSADTAPTVPLQANLIASSASSASADQVKSKLRGTFNG